MNAVSNISSWKLTVRREEDAVTILHAVTCDREAVLPDTVFGLPVKKIGERAFAPDPGAVTGESVELLRGSSSDSFDNSRLESLALPASVEYIGSYAFMKCRSLRKLRLGSGIRYFGASLFMNCRSLSVFEIMQKTSCDYDTISCEAVSYIAHELPGELDISFIGEDGNVSCRLIFPEYIERLTENMPVHMFCLTVEGGGYPYHSLFVRNGLKLSEYDGLWDGYISGEHEDDTAVRIAMMRIRYPAGLSERADSSYRKYLRAHLRQAMLISIEERDLIGLQELSSESGVTAEDLSAALCRTRELSMTEATAVLLEKRSCLSPHSAGNRYDL